MAAYGAASADLRQAVQLDSEGRLVEALFLYNSGVGKLTAAIRGDDDPARRAQVQQKLDQYGARAQVIHGEIGAQQAPVEPTSPTMEFEVR